MQLVFTLDLQKHFKMRYSGLIVIVLLICTSCTKRLDDFLFNGDNSIDAYYLDDYKGGVSVSLENQYYMPDHLIHQFTYEIEEEGEKLAIAAIYTGNTATIDTDTVILYCHGNRDHMDFYWPRQKMYSHIGNQGRYGVLMIDYPGFGMSDGTSTEENMYASIDGALKWLKSKGLTDDRLVIFGFSLGSAGACKVAAGGFEMNPSKLILEAPFASSEVMVQDAALLAMPGSFLVNVKIDNAEQIKNVEAPLLWIHGVDDGFLAMDTHGEVVFNNHTGEKKAVRVPGADHDGASAVPVFMGFETYLETIKDFITE